MKTSLLLFFSTLSSFCSSQIKVDDFYSEADGKDWSIAINKALVKLDSIGHGSLEFTGTQNYFVSNTLELPRYAKGGIRRIIILNGNGCTIRTNDSIIIFNRIPKNQDEALNKMMSTRFVFNDFTIVGGKKAINLGATFGSSINRCNFTNQTHAAIDIQFGLNTHVLQCNSNGACKNHYVLRTGSDWGGNGVNSQSNHSVIEMSRAYAGKGECVFKILGSSGCVIRDCISEGNNEIDYSIYFDILGSTTVRLFKIENLHLEHAPKKAGIYLRNTGIATIDGIFYQKAYANFPLVYSANRCDQISLLRVPHFVQGTILEQEGGNDGACWVVEDCSKEFYDPANWRIHMKDGVQNKLPYYFKGKGYRYQLNKEFKGGK
jgi:hypothetical protein